MDYKILAKKIFSKRGWPILIYILANILVTAYMVSLFTRGNVNPPSFPVCILIAVVLQAIVTVFVLSPIGEFVMRSYNGGRKIKSEYYKSLIRPLFDEVYDRAKTFDPKMPKGVQVFIKNENTMNAFAIGRKSVVVHTGILQMEDQEQIKGILGHEMGHLAHQDTALLMIILGSNIFIFGLLWAVSLLMNIIMSVTGVGTIGNRTGKEDKDSWLALIVNTVICGLINIVYRIWVFFGALTMNPMMRKEEYGADAFSTKLGYGRAMVRFFEELGSEKPKGIMGTIYRTHPSDQDRVRAMNEIMAQEPSLAEGIPSVGIEPGERDDIYVEPIGYRVGDDQSISEPETIDETIPVPVAAVVGEQDREETKHCPYCGEIIDADADYCPFCGKKATKKTIIKVCPQCGTRAESIEDVYCGISNKVG